MIWKPDNDVFWSWGNPTMWVAYYDGGYEPIGQKVTRKLLVLFTNVHGWSFSHNVTSEDYQICENIKKLLFKNGELAQILGFWISNTDTLTPTIQSGSRFPNSAVMYLWKRDCLGISPNSIWIPVSRWWSVQRKYFSGNAVTGCSVWLMSPAYVILIDVHRSLCETSDRFWVLLRRLNCQRRVVRFCELHPWLGLDSTKISHIWGNSVLIWLIM